MKKALFLALAAVLLTTVHSQAQSQIFGPGNYGTYNPWEVTASANGYGGPAKQIGPWSLQSTGVPLIPLPTNTGNPAANSLNHFLNNVQTNTLNTAFNAAVNLNVMERAAITPSNSVYGNALYIPNGVLDIANASVKHSATFDTADFSNPLLVGPGVYEFSFFISQRDEILDLLGDFVLTVKTAYQELTFSNAEILALFDDIAGYIVIPFTVASGQAPTAVSLNITMKTSANAGLDSPLVIKELALTQTAVY